ncbi:MAG: signal peptidase I [Neomegalonema sp.]
MSDSSEPKGAQTERPKESLGEIFRTVIYALLIALVFRTLLFQPFSIPSGSMKSTLLIGDYLFVSKYAYGYSRYSLPYGKYIPFEGRIFGAEPERGDVIVFKLPRDNQTDYIKRLVGLPGDRIQMKNGRLHINGAPVQVQPDGEFVEPNVRQGPERRPPRCIRPISTATDCVKQSFVETLPGDVTHTILSIDGGRGSMNNTSVYTVPEGHYFFMGDNRDNSQDSRTIVGFVPFENLLGRADLVLLSSSGAFWEIWNWRGDRFFQSID